MLTPEENETLTRVGPTAPMGRFLRRYWVPALLAEEVPPPGGAPVRCRILGEDLVLFCDQDGHLALLDEHCAHRRASLYYGRNEGVGLRCVYHGWMFDRHGQCIDMPSEPPESAFKEKVRIAAYPAVVQAGVVWAYLGPGEPPPLPAMEWMTLPASHCVVSKHLAECNWFQVLEGAIDSSHISFLHRLSDPAHPKNRFEQLKLGDPHPRFEVAETPYGLAVGARRSVGDDQYWWRITQYLCPYYTLIPPVEEGWIGAFFVAPIDDTATWVFRARYHPEKPQTQNYPTPDRYEPGTYRLARNRDNEYRIDREAQLNGTSYTGIDGIAEQDLMVAETEGVIYDRTLERLGTSDVGIIRCRQYLLHHVAAFLAGATPPNLDPREHRVRPVSMILPRSVPFMEGAREAMRASPGVPVFVVA